MQLNIIDKSEDIQWLDFETRMRRVIKDLMHPMVEKVQDMLQTNNLMQRDTLKHSERLLAIELIVLKDQDVNSIIDDLKTRIE